MSVRPAGSEQRKVRSIARRYERDGYVVSVPEHRGTPEFLEGFVPDLIAKSTDDNVVIEVKSSGAVRGANDLKAVAERVARQPGWRFELVTIADEQPAALPAAPRLATIEEQVRQAVRAGAPDLGFAYAWLLVEEVLTDLAARHGLDASRMSPVQAARTLVSRGVLSERQLDTVRSARSIRNRLVHAEVEDLPSEVDVFELTRLAQDFYNAILAVTPSD